MLSDGLKALGKDEAIEVMDLAVVVAAQLPAEAPRPEASA
jgi:hypothetical protein